MSAAAVPGWLAGIAFVMLGVIMVCLVVMLVLLVASIGRDMWKGKP
jgi:hypothetical protein